MRDACTLTLHWQVMLLMLISTCNLPVLMQVAITVLHMSRTALGSGELTIVVASQCVLLWFRLNYFSR